MGTDEQTPDATAEQEPTRPLLRVVSPDATPEEVAALVAVLSSMGGGEPPAKRPRPEWSAPHRLVRRTLPHGPGGWRASALPR
ncbi:acyl-CoA carboxylase subunit epsilon [Nocardioides deserti]|uniref:Acyl-CoA carboxylase subunit epsilon n=1 Tax=Nocardioides deserti TaxID=1588644 RepID=A0ABR6U939_9ACTN|nr:acyl-CoA carboxylase subunit epsilon [Nocardioides deserti]MBC2960964.1 acyl-CoA carboxylase subunit epsilon [Nocardioides deserti]GGO75958.1 acetyl-CoA carboxylase biotin carboxyl carrier protein subunit [Nocardioides deserti]